MASIFVNYFHEVADLIKSEGLSKNSMEDLIEWGEAYGRFLYTNYADIYRDDDFENELMSRIDCIAPTSKNEIQHKVLHVISQAYNTGGHTRLLEKIILGGEKGDILITRNESSSEIKEAARINCTVFERKQGFSVSELIDIFSQYRCIYLYLHPDDLRAFSVAGACRKNGVKVVMVNHADHVFSFGFNCVDEVAEVSLYGLKLTKERRNIASGFIGIPLSNSEFSEIKSCNSGKTISLLSGATSLKYKPSVTGSFPEFAIDLIRKTNNINVTVIGPNLRKDFWWWKAKFHCGKRLKIYKKLSYNSYIDKVNHADLYVDSFPMTGGTGFPEVRGNNIVVSGLACGSSGYTPCDGLKYHSKDELIENIVQFSKYKKESHLYKNNNNHELLALASNVHNDKNVVARLVNLTKNSIKDPVYEGNEKIDIDFYFTSWVNKAEVEFGKQLYQFFFKEWKSGGKDVIKLFLKNQNWILRVKFMILKIKAYKE